MQLVFYCFAVALAIIKLNFNVYHGDDIKQLKTSKQNKQGAFLTQRDGSELMIIENAKTWYLAELQFGQNKEKVLVLIDTGSSDLWLHDHDVFCAQSLDYNFRLEVVDSKEIDDESKDSSYSFASSAIWSSIISQATATDTCTGYGSFNTADSDSYHVNDTTPAFQLFDFYGTMAWGTWGFDSVFFGDVEVKDLSFAVANFTNSEMGVLGIGLPTLEMTYNSYLESGYQYENFPMKLKSQGLIEKNVYSLYLDKMSAGSGTVLFGAVDHAKYEGQLQTVPMTGMYSGNSSVVRTQVILSGVTYVSNDEAITISEGNKYTAIFDSSRTLSRFPIDLYYEFVHTLNLTDSGTFFKDSLAYSNYMIPCTNGREIKIEFDFNGAIIKVPLIDFMIPTETGECILGVNVDDDFIVGNNILRNGYFVFDLEDEEISMAQVRYNDVEDIEVVSSTIPSATRIKQYSSTDTSTDTRYPYVSATDTRVATYATEEYSVDGGFYSAFWGISNSITGDQGFSATTGTQGSSTTTSTWFSATNARGSSTTGTGGCNDKSTVGYIASFFSLVLAIIFL